MGNRIKEEMCVEELDLSVRAYRLLKNAKLNVIHDVLQFSMADFWSKICKKSKICFNEILLRLDEFGYRLTDCGQKEYPQLDAALAGIVFQLENESKINKNTCRRKEIEQFSSDHIFTQTGITLPKLNMKDLFYVEAEPEFHLKRFGIMPGATMVFDRTKPFSDGVLSCFAQDQEFISFSNSALPVGQHLGKLVAVLNYY